MDYKSIIADITAKKFKPIYFLHGEEPYFMDLISDKLQENVLEEHERDFNQSIFYGKDADPLTIISDAKAYPMMSERRLVVIREAQDVKNWDLFASYFKQPNPQTILLIAHKYKKIDGRKAIFKDVAKSGILFESQKVKDYQLVDWISNYVKTTGFTISPKASFLLADFLGNNLNKIVNELDKLAIILQKGTLISDAHIEENIGISKDYNIFELSDAISSTDLTKAMKIVYYFEQNPKAADLVPVISNLFSLFVNLMKIQVIPNKSKENLAQQLKLHPFYVTKLIQASKSYNIKKVAQNIEILHEYDLKSKGLGNTSFTPGELMREMVYKLLN